MSWPFSLANLLFSVCLPRLSFLFYFCLSCSIPTISYIITETMEYEQAISSTSLSLVMQETSPTTNLPGRGHSCVKGDGYGDTKLFSQLITFPFSGRSNHLLKVPVTERLCHLSNGDITRRCPVTRTHQPLSPMGRGGGWDNCSREHDGAV